MIEPPETHYAKVPNGAHIAYQVCGDGPDLVFIALNAGHVELAWEVPAFAAVFRRLASFSRLIRFDPRGVGMSDPLGHDERPSLERRAEDLLAVLDTLGVERATLCAHYTGGLEAVVFAASYADRIASLVLDGCFARMLRAPDYPAGIPLELVEPALPRINDWDTGEPIDYTGLRYLAPRSVQDPDFSAPFRRFFRSTISPANANAMTDLAVHSDVRSLLPSVQAPTLVMYRRDDQLAGKPHASYLAEHISHARLVEVPGGENWIFVDNDADFDELQEFVTGVRPTPRSDRVLATVLFTDIVGSTERAAELGDKKWGALIDDHDRTVRRQLERFRGREIHTTGDGFLATFDGPGRAIDCACAIRDAARTLGIEIRAGVHIGEIDVRGDDIAGVAVHIGARVATLAGAGEVLVSSTVKDLVVGSGFDFTDRGEHELKGVPGTWRLFSVEGAS